MLEIMNSGPVEMTRAEDRNAIFLNCWEKSSPLIKELERTVNFAERKCGDLMQQLHFYREYYKKWVHAEQINNACAKKKIKKCCRQKCDNESSSENEREKVNQYFYKKIKSKINEVNSKITEANRKLSSKNESFLSCEKDNPVGKLNSEDDCYGDVISSKAGENKVSKSEPAVTLPKEKPELSSDVSQFDDGNLKISEKYSSKSVPSRKKKDDVQLRRRYSNLQRFKIRSKSLPQGVRRKFGFGGFFEVVDSATIRDESSNFKTVKAESCKNLKIRKNEGRARIDLGKRSSGFSLKSRKSSRKSGRCSHRQHSKPKSELKSSYGISRTHFSNNIKSDSGAENPEKCERINQPKSQALCPKSGIGSCNSKTIIPTGVPFDIKTCDAGSKSGDDFQANIGRFESKPNTLMSLLRQPIPFIPCSSTSKTFNLGLNIQQVLSLIKQKRHSVNLQAMVKSNMQAARVMKSKGEPAVNTLFFSQMTTRHSHVTSTICPAREESDDTFSVLTDAIGCRSKCSILKQVQSTRSQAPEEVKISNFTGMETEPQIERFEGNKYERPEDVWVVEQPDAALRKVRMKCTCFPSKQCVDYHKVLRQYTGWRFPGPKGETLTLETPSFSPVIDCQKSKFCGTSSKENFHVIPGEKDGRVELIKVHNDLINLNRKYSSLQEQIAQNNFVDHEADAELEAMETELAIKEVEFKDILNFYNQLMLLKEKLKSLRLKSRQSQPAIQQPGSQRPKKDPLRPTPSMALTKVLRKIQGLQDKIKLIDAP